MPRSRSACCRRTRAACSCPSSDPKRASASSRAAWLADLRANQVAQALHFETGFFEQSLKAGDLGTGQIPGKAVVPGIDAGQRLPRRHPVPHLGAGSDDAPGHLGGQPRGIDGLQAADAFLPDFQVGLGGRRHGHGDGGFRQ
nr:hypothetical protein [Methylomarinovum sp. IN45]